MIRCKVNMFSPVSVFGQEISINSFHQVLKPSRHVRLFRRRLRLNDLEKQYDYFLRCSEQVSRGAQILKSLIPLSFYSICKV